MSIAANKFYRAVREFAVTAPVWEASAIRYFTLPDEQWDVTLVSQRVYGNRNESLAIMAAAGLDRTDQPLTPRMLVLPSAAMLAAIKQRTGYTGGN